MFEEVWRSYTTDKVHNENYDWVIRILTAERLINIMR